MSDKNEKKGQRLVKVLAALLILTLCLAILQWFIIKELFSFGADMVKDALIRQAPKDVKRVDIEATFERVKSAGMQLPFSFLTGELTSVRPEPPEDMRLKQTVMKSGTLMKLIHSCE